MSHRYKPIENVIDPTEEEPDNTICHTHRILWRLADELQNDELKRLIEIAYDQGVRMDNKLKSYRRKFIQVDKALRSEPNVGE
jgi:hypothetical protein